MHSLESISGKSAASERAIRAFQRLAKNRQSRGRQDLVNHCLDTYLLLDSWNCNEPICLAGLLATLMIRDEVRRDLYWFDFVHSIDDPSRQLAEAVGNAAASISRANHVGFGPAIDIRDSDVCDILAAQALSSMQSTPSVSIDDLKKTICTISAGMRSGAYKYCLSSNILLGLPVNVHALAQQHVLNQLLRSSVQKVPCRYALATEVFPDSFFETMLRLLPSLADFHPIQTSQAYDDACQQRLGA